MKLYPSGLLIAVFLLTQALPAAAWETNDWDFLDTIEYTHFKMFRETKIGPYGLTCDMIVYDNPYNYGPITSIAGIGFKLSAMCIGHYRGWVSYDEAYGEVLRLLKAFGNELSSDPNVFPRVNGWTYHFYNNADGTMNDKDGLSLLDHMLFISGVITAGEYFKGTEAADIALRLYSETQWDNTWSGDGDYVNWGYAENLLAIVEAADAPQHNKHSTASNMWATVTAGVPYHLPLYYWQYPHSYVDFRDRLDPRNLNHENIARDTILHQIQWCNDRFWDWKLSGGWECATYTNSTFGLSACGSSTGYRILNAIDEWSADSGSITPICIPPCMIYAGTETMATLKNLFEEYYVKGWSAPRIPVWSDVYGFANCYNIGQPSDSGRSEYYNPFNADIDYGPNVLLIENYRLGTTWRYFMQNPYIATGMHTLGFGPVQNVSFADFTNALNQFGGGLGAWANGGATSDAVFVSGTYVNPYVAGDYVRIAANGPRCGGWITLGDRDQRGHAQVSFWARADSGQEQVRVGLKDVWGRENKVELAGYTGGQTPTNWTEVKIPIEAFCITGVASNDVWPGNLGLLSFEFTNAAGGGLDIDYVAFGPDTGAPATPTGRIDVAHFRGVPRVHWETQDRERDVAGYALWRRPGGADDFARAGRLLAPAHQGYGDDESFAGALGEFIEYGIQAVDNAGAANASGMGPSNRFVYLGGGRTDVDWNNGRNPNVFGGTNDGYWGAATPHALDFVEELLPFGWTGWVRRSYVSTGDGGHYIDLNSGDAGDSAALAFYIRGAVGGESIAVGLKDSDDHETKLPAEAYLAGPVGTAWQRVVIPFGDFTNVDMTSLYNVSFTHTASGTVFIADLGFLLGQRPELVNTRLFEAEHSVTQRGARVRDFKPAASGREVLGEGWGADTNSTAEYDVFIDEPLDSQHLNVRYACWSGDGRAVRVTWNGASAGTFNCVNTGGWGEDSWHYGWARCALPALTAGWHRMKLTVDGPDSSVNLDCFTITEEEPWFRECEDFDSQVGSGGDDFKAGASGGEVLGSSWGTNAASEAVYSNVGTRALSGAWFHLWYALHSYSGRVVNVYVDGALKAQLICPRTGGWGERAYQFGCASACIGNLGAGSHTVRLEVPYGDVPVNLDCFGITETPPEAQAMDTDGDGLGDREEAVLGANPDLADTDNDGLTDGEEWLAGTDPCSDGSVFQCSEILAEDLPMLGMVLRWPSVSGRVYGISASSNLLTSDFWPLTSGLPATPPENVWTDAVGEAESLRLYRIDVRRE
ncbi:MAG: hypothetical protein JXB04_05340 [Kiritimatiellae bacterium]|nr:hypothetical protein [Kiritimatiellia bacterium]